MSYLARKKTSKILILGLAQSGKSTIIRVVTEGKIPSKEEPYHATIDYERKQKVIAGTELTIFDLGGQTAFLDRFTGELSEFIFSGVKSLVFVVDSIEIKDISRAKYYLDLSLKKLSQFSPEATIFIFQHKTDLIPKKLKDEVKKTINDYLSSGVTQKMKYFSTSVFDDSIFRAMGDVYAEASGARKTLRPLLETFIRHNGADMAQIFTKEGAPLTKVKEISRFEHITLSEVKNFFDAVVERLADSENQKSTSILVESDRRVFIIRFMESGLALFFGFPKDLLREKNEQIPSLYNKVLAFSSQLKSMIES
ncbi:MAG: 50S ribosome-binding GTPase [Candidatus Heimdallarchaeota archaeon]|nr:MAG: 50S ribosome-binding GTPase [Candidatus Heimdallarchaeota archaeon]